MESVVDHPNARRIRINLKADHSIIVNNNNRSNNHRNTNTNNKDNKSNNNYKSNKSTCNFNGAWHGAQCAGGHS